MREVSASRIIVRIVAVLCAAFSILVIGAWRVGREVSQALFVSALVSVWLLLVVGWLFRKKDPMLASVATVLSVILLCLLFVIPIGSGN